MRERMHLIALSLVTAMAMVWAGCENLPGDERSQGAVIGGVSGAAVGAAVGGRENRALGALLGGLLGAGGGYIVGAQVDRLEGRDRDEAVRAGRQAEANPARPEDALRATTADLNKDGFVTLDEVVAMETANLTDQEILSRLEATNQVFELTEEQKAYLVERGVSRSVVDQLENINREQRDRLLGTTGSSTISR